MKVISIILAIAITFGCYANDEIVDPTCKIKVAIPYSKNEKNIEQKYLELFQITLTNKNYSVNFVNGLNEEQLEENFTADTTLLIGGIFKFEEKKIHLDEKDGPGRGHQQECPRMYLSMYQLKNQEATEIREIRLNLTVRRISKTSADNESFFKTCISVAVSLFPTCVKKQ